MEGERVLGGFETLAKLVHGQEHLILLFTQRSIILASTAKLGRASMALSQLLGGMASGAEQAGKKGQLEKFSQKSPSEILKMNDANFEIAYDSIVTLLVEREPEDRRRITLVTDREKFIFEASRKAVDGVKELMASVIGSKLDFRP